MSTMRAVTFTTPGPPEVLTVTQAPVPAPEPGELLVRVLAACVNPVDTAVRRGAFHGLWFTGTPQLGLGWDVAGTVESIGSGVEGFAVGDRVLAMNNRFARPTGAHAELVTVPASAAAAIPAGLDAVTASTLPLNGNTAAESLELLALKPGQTLLVTGASGAVGGFAVALAAHAGVEVSALAAGPDAELLRAAGATRILPRSGDLGAVAPFDAVLDAAMLGDRALPAVAEGGVFCSVAPSVTPQSERGIRVETVKAQALGERTARLAELTVQGVLRPRIAGTLPLTEAVQAHQRIEAGLTRARWVLVP